MSYDWENVRWRCSERRRESPLANVPRRILRFVISAKKRSTALSHDELVGVKWTWYLGWAAHHALTTACLCVA
jgi:hypothetical protein